MKNILMITFYGNIFLFDNNLSLAECSLLQQLANSEQFRKSLDFNDSASILSKYLDAVKQDLGITLDTVKISYIVRIKQ